ncbi:hypothetical protein MXB_1619 [Myxobolus squamalis]|nr:hypothetical protein MXB_1619 [Myxobolus squamalis]
MGTLIYISFQISA